MDFYKVVKSSVSQPPLSCINTFHSMSTVSYLNRHKKLTVSIGILLCRLAAGVLPTCDCTSTMHPSGLTPVHCLDGITLLSPSWGSSGTAREQESGGCPRLLPWLRACSVSSTCGLMAAVGRSMRLCRSPANGGSPPKGLLCPGCLQDREGG